MESRLRDLLTKMESWPQTHTTIREVTFTLCYELEQTETGTCGHETQKQSTGIRAEIKKNFQNMDILIIIDMEPKSYGNRVKHELGYKKQKGWT